MPAHSPSIQSVAIVGAGIIGLSCALALADRDVNVTLYEKQWPPRGASWAAAGMLAPAYEAASAPGTHPRLFDLCHASAALWGQWAAMLEDRSGLPSGYTPGPSLAIALSAAEADRLSRIQAQLAHQTLPPEPCLDRLSAVEPALATPVEAALLLPSDGQVDNRRTLEALIAAVSTDPKITIVTGVPPLRMSSRGVDHAGHGATLVTAGWRSAEVLASSDAPVKTLQDLDPVFAEIEAFGGQMLSVAPIEGGPTMTIRSGHLYIVPKSDRVVIGATTEPGRTDGQTDDQAIHSLRQRAIALCPALEAAPVLETWAGVRPGTRDHAPLLGETRVERLFVAAGHYRNGILLAPITAQIMADLIVAGEVSELASEFAPHARFATPV